MARILLIDDDPDVRRSLVTVLRRSGHEVLGAANGRDGIDAQSRFGPELVITDINMPEMDGIEVITLLLEARPEVPVIAISGGGLVDKESLLDDAGLLGAVSTLEKPFEIATLLAAVNAAIEGATE